MDALDPIQTMLDATRNRTIEAGVDSGVTTRIGDVHALHFPDESFDLVLALGVLPWNRSFAAGVKLLTAKSLSTTNIAICVHSRRFSMSLLAQLNSSTRVFNSAFTVCSFSLVHRSSSLEVSHSSFVDCNSSLTDESSSSTDLSCSFEDSSCSVVDSASDQLPKVTWSDLSE